MLQPDISAPGVNILAGFSPLLSPSHKLLDERRSNVSFLSGTSMACPHVAGAAAYVKSFHPTWSPSAIKSAIMTTGNGILNHAFFFVFSANHVLISCHKFLFCSYRDV